MHKDAAPLRNHNGDTYFLEVAEMAADLREEFARYSKAKTWAHTADRVNFGGIAQASMTIREAKQPWAESAADKKLRLAAKQFLTQLEAARDRRIIGAADAGPEFEEWIVGEFAPAIQAAKKFAQPAPMTAIWHVADKVRDALAMANSACQADAKGKRRLIPTGLGVDGPVIQLTFMALKLSGALRDMDSDPDDGDGKMFDVIRKHVEKRLR